jgi:hypothetical protein
MTKQREEEVSMWISLFTISLAAAIALSVMAIAMQSEERIRY